MLRNFGPVDVNFKYIISHSAMTAMVFMHSEHSVIPMTADTLDKTMSCKDLVYF